MGDIVAYLSDKDCVGAYDAIGEQETTMQTGQVLAQLGGGFVASSYFIPEDMPATVEGKMGK